MAVADISFVRVPDPDEMNEAEYIDAPELDDLLTEIVSKYAALSVIEQYGISVKVLWKRKGGKKGGHPVYGRCDKASGLVGHFSRSDFVIWLAADNIKAEEWTTEQVKKVLYHQARHIGWRHPDPTKEDDDGAPIKLQPDLHVFVGEVKDTGSWDRMRRAVAKDFEQPGLGL